MSRPSLRATWPRVPRRLGVLSTIVGLLRPAHAELPRPRLDRIFPLGAQAGSVVTLEIQGKDLDGSKSLRIDHPGIQAEWIKETQFRLTIAADVPSGDLPQG